MKTKLCFLVFCFLVICLLGMTQGRGTARGGRRVSASEDDIQNWCGGGGDGGGGGGGQSVDPNEAYAGVGAPKNSSKMISLPPPCFKCKCDDSRTCYCCLVDRSCWATQADCYQLCPVSPPSD